MSDGQEGHTKWLLRYVIVPLAVVVIGAGATYYFSHLNDARGGDASYADQSGAGDMTTEAGTDQGAVQGTPSGTVPPPPGSGDSVASRNPDGSVTVEAPDSMGNRD